MTKDDANRNNKNVAIFHFFNEIGIIHQLSSALLNRRLPDGLHISHFSVLNHLSRRPGGEMPLQLADAFQVSKGTMTHTVGVLLKRRFVRLEPHKSDRRSKIVHITETGSKFVQLSITSLGPSIAKLAALVDVSVMQDMLPELETIRMILDENRNI